jgi:CRP-like cAMP-binding protein
MARAPVPMIALDIQVSGKVLSRLSEMAAKAGMKQRQYTQLLFDLAYAAKAGAATVDVNIDRTVSAIALTLELDEADVAAELGCTVETVRRIRQAWRDTFATAP